MTTTELVEKIKRILVNPEGIDEESLRRLASTYAARCRRLNDRLERAVACVKSGSLCEADRIERDGALIDEYQTLSFDRYEEWIAVCKSLGFDAAAPVSADNGSELQLFIYAYEEVRDLFSLHRRLAAIGAPFERRLDVLYKLAEKFPQRPTLTRSIDALEKARDQELTDALKRKDAPIDAEQAKRIVEELSSPLRYNAPPKELIQAYQKRYAQASNARLVERARDCLTAWAQAKLDEDEAKMLEILERYRAGGYAAFLPELEPEEQEAFRLLERETIALERQAQTRTELRRKTRELSRAVGTSYDADKLANMLAETELMAENANMTLDEDTTRAAEERVETLVLQRERRNRFLIATASALLVLFGGAVLFVLAQTQTDRKASAAAEILENKLDEFAKNPSRIDILEDAKKKVEKDRKNDPKFLDRPDYAAAVERLKSALDSEKQRAANLQIEFAKAEEAHRVGAPYPNNLRALEKQCATSEEKTRYSQLFEEESKLKTKTQGDARQGFDAEIDELGNAIQDASNADAAQREQRLVNVQNQLNSLKKRIEYASLQADYQEKLDALEQAASARLDEARRRLSEDSASATLTDRLLQEVGKVSTYCEALRSAESIGAEGSELVQAAVADARRVESLKMWNALAKTHCASSEWLADAESFEELAAFADDDANRAAPEFEALAKQVDTWRAFGESGGLAAVKSALEEALKRFERPEFVCYKISDERYDYLTQKPENEKDRSVERYVDASGETASYSLKIRTDDEIRSIAESYQHSVYQEFQNRSPDTIADFVDFVVNKNILNMIDAPAPELDPGVKLILLDAFYNALADVPCMASVVADYRRTRAGSAIDQEYDYFDYAAQKQAREEIKAIQDDLASLKDKTKQACEKTLASLQTQLASYTWVGFIDVEGNKSIVKTAQIELTNGAELWVFHGSPVEASRCGDVVNGRAMIDTEKDWAAYRWTPVYERTEIEAQ